MLEGLLCLFFAGGVGYWAARLVGRLDRIERERGSRADSPARVIAAGEPSLVRRTTVLDATERVGELEDSLDEERATTHSDICGVGGTRPSVREEERLAALVERSPVASAIVDGAGRVVRVSRGLEELFGSAENVAADGGWSIALGDRIRQEILRGDEAEGQTTFRRSDGEERLLRWSAMSAESDSGDVLIFCEDVTETRLAQEEMRESREQFQSAFEWAPIGMALVAPNGSWLKVNHALCSILGYKPEELARKTFHDLTHEEDLYSGSESLRRVLAGEIPFCQQEKRYFHKDGRIVWVLLSISKVRSCDERDAYLIFQIQDITESKRQREELRTAKEDADAASLAKGQFLANMSHEIRTPIHGVIGMIDLVLESQREGEPRRCLELARSSAASLLAILNDVLDFSKIEAGKMELAPTDFCLRSCVDSVLDGFFYAAGQKGVYLRSEIARDVPEFLRGDAGRLRQVLVNLISNAIRFTDVGGVEVFVASRPIDEILTELRFEVRDTGIGVNDEQKRRIFDAFRQADESTTRKYGGTGLGLAICRELTTLMGGEISVDSELERGSTFWFTVRLERSAAPAAAHATDLRELRVLCVDASEERVEEWKNLLREMVGEVESAANVGEAIDRLRGSTTHPDVVVYDHLGDEEGGREGLVERLRAEASFGGAFIRIARHGSRGDGRRCREAGVRAYLNEPLFPADLRAALREITSADDRLVTRHSIREDRKATRVLVADDSEICQELARCLLGRWGYSTEIVENGRLAVERATKSSYDLVLMDMQMPVLDGVGAIREIREAEAGTGARLPILAMTANVRPEDRDRCLAAGADACVSKPISADDLRRHVEEVLVAGRRSHPRPGAPAGDTGPGQSRSESIAPPEPIAAAIEPLVLDHAVLRVNFGDSLADLGPRLARVLVEEQPRQLASLRTALALDEPEEVRRIVHSLKSAFAQFGAVDGSRLAGRMEGWARDGELERCRESEGALIAQVAGLRAALEGEGWLEPAVAKA